MSPVFLDTVGLLAIWNLHDQWHQPAKEAFARLVAGRRPTITTTCILLECGNVAARRPFRLEVDLLRQALQSRDMLLAPTDLDWQQAWAAYRRGDNAQAGIVDHISFAVMRRLGISDALSNDRHFQAAGFRTLF